MTTVAADFDEDGHLDVAVANRLSDTVSILLGDGLGGFDASPTLSFPGEPKSLSAGDLNEDGHLDFAVYATGLSLSLSEACDCNGNGIWDPTDVGTGSVADCNNNGEIDECEIANGTQPDADANGVPDSCEVFLRGDANGDGSRNFIDSTYSLAYMFLAGPSVCLDSHDENDDGSVNILDPVFALTHQFAGGPPPSSPYPECGADLTVDALDGGCTGGCP